MPVIDRRDVLRAGGACGSVLLSGCLDSVVATVEAFTETEVIDRIRWGGGELRLWFRESHGTDGFTIAHVDDDPYLDRIVTGATPEGEGRVEFPLADILADEERSFPSPLFYLHFWTGSFREWEALYATRRLDEHVGRMRFYIPREQRPSGLLES